MNSTNSEYTQFILLLLGNYFRKQRAIHGHKQETISHYTGISHGVISKIENGAYKPLRVDQVIKLLLFYNNGAENLAKEVIDRISETETENSG